ncbi:MAG: aminotransferase class IV [Acidimicrobiales bacterium]
MGSVYVNGKFVDEADAVVSVFDHGLLTGDGVFESVAIRAGRPFALERHLERLERSACLLGLAIPPLDQLRVAVHGVVEAGGYATGKIRITLTGGPGPLGSARGGAGPTVIVAAEQLSGDVGVAKVVVAPWPKSELSPTAGAKTISYAENVVALAYAASKGANEALFVNLAGQLCEGTGSNIFVEVGGRLVTPELDSGCLAGVTRGLILENTDATEAVVDRAALEAASEAFLSSTTRGVQPLASIDDRTLPECPGPLTKAASDAFAVLVAQGEP